MKGREVSNLCALETLDLGVSYCSAQEEPAPSTEVEPSTTVKIEAEAAAAEEAAMEAADQVEGADQQAAAASVPAAVEASPQPPVQLPAGVTVKREPEVEQLPRRRSKRLKQEP
jgi:hypothetical protein